MAVRKLVYWPSTVLKEVSATVSPEEQGSDEFKRLVQDMFETMKAHRGLGLAAIQVGVPLRVFVMDARGALTRHDANVLPRPQAFVNPVVFETIDDPVLVYEGCLSVPGYSEQVLRYHEVIISSQLESGQTVRWQLADSEAQCAQHEIEHLDGHLFVDGAGVAKRDIIRRKVLKALSKR